MKNILLNMANQEPLWNKLYNTKLVWKKETINLPKLFRGKSILELGVGTGKTLKSILKQKPKSVTAIDFSEEALKICKDSIEDSQVMFVNSNILAFNPKEKFDIIVCYYVLNNLTKEERKKAIEKMKELLTEKGIILFEDFAKGDFRENVKRKDDLFCHFFSETEVKELFDVFSDIQIKTRTSSPIRKDKNLQRKIISAIIQR